MFSFFLKLNFDYALRLTNYLMLHVPFGYIRNKQKNKTIMKLFRISRKFETWRKGKKSHEEILKY